MSWWWWTDVEWKAWSIWHEEDNYCAAPGWYAQAWGPAARRSWSGPCPAAASTDDPWANVGATQWIPWPGSVREEAPVVNECDPSKLADHLEVQKPVVPEPSLKAHEGLKTHQGSSTLKSPESRRLTVIEECGADEKSKAECNEECHEECGDDLARWAEVQAIWEKQKKRRAALVASSWERHTRNRPSGGAAI